MLWSPYVPKGMLTEGLSKMGKDLNMNIELVINEEYTKRIKKLQVKAKEDKKDRGELFYRALQILGHIK
jgi:DNA invertase Pin-like site-specific DNA recombinase